MIKAIAMLPPLHPQILREYLQSISSMDGMPNNALTYWWEKNLKSEADSGTAFGLTERSLNESEGTCFNWVPTSITPECGAGQGKEVGLLHNQRYLVQR